MPQLDTKDKEFLGNLAYGAALEFARENPKATPSDFRLWTELSDEERERFTFIGEVLLNAFRGIEGNRTLQEELIAMTKSFEEIKRAYQKRWKDEGGR